MRLLSDLHAALAWLMAPAHFSMRARVVVFACWLLIALPPLLMVPWERQLDDGDRDVESRFFWLGEPSRLTPNLGSMPWQINYAAWLGSAVCGVICAMGCQTLLRYEARARRWNKGLCWNCGHDLRAAPTVICPECGVDARWSPDTPAGGD